MESASRTPLWLSRMDKRLSSMGRAVSLFACIFECILCTRLVLFNIQRIELPCGSDICAQLELDALSRPGGVYLGWYGLMGAALMVGFHISLARQNNRIIRILTTAVAFIGVVTSIGLIGHVYLVYHDTCPWCVTSAAAWFVCLGGWLLCEVAPANRWPRFWLLGALLTLAAAALEANVEIRLRATGAELTSVRWTELVVPGRAISATSSDDSIVIFVSLDCQACKDALRRALSSNSKVGVLLRIARAQSDYARQASMLVLGCPTVELRRAALSELVKDPTDNPLTITRVQKLLDLRQTAHAAAELDHDLRMAKRLGIRNVPVFIRVIRHKVALIDKSDPN